MCNEKKKEMTVHKNEICSAPHASDLEPNTADVTLTRGPTRRKPLLTIHAQCNRENIGTRSDKLAQRQRHESKPRCCSKGLSFMVETLSRGGGGSATRAAAGPSMAKENSSCVEALNCCEIVLSFWLLVRPASSSNEHRSQQAEHQCYQPPKTQESLPT